MTSFDYYDHPSVRTTSRPERRDPFYEFQPTQNQVLTRYETEEGAYPRRERQYTSRTSEPYYSREGPGSGAPKHVTYDRYYSSFEKPRSAEHERRMVQHVSRETLDRERQLSKQEKMIASVFGAALAFGGKKVFDHHRAGDSDSEDEGKEKNMVDNLINVAVAAGGAFAGYKGAEIIKKRVSDSDHKAPKGMLTYGDKQPGSGDDMGGNSFLKSALGATGLGTMLTKFVGSTNAEEKKPTDGRSADGQKGGGGNVPNMAERVQKAAMASLLAGATEAFRIAKKPGSWKGEKFTRVMTAAAGAGALDATQNAKKHSKLGLAEAVVGGLLGNRVFNGSKNGLYADEKGRSRSASRGRSSGTGLGALAAAGLGAAGANQLLGRSRSRSRARDDHDDYYDNRGRARSHSQSSSRTRSHSRSRSRSVIDSGRRALARLGIVDDEDDLRQGRSRAASRGRGRRYNEYDDDDYDTGYVSDDRRRQRSLSRDPRSR